MTTAYLETIVLYCLKQINGERSVYSIYHLLKGKKSAQTIQDIHLFQLKVFFQAFPSLSRLEIEKIIFRFETAGWIHKTMDQHFCLTARGRDILEEALLDKPIPGYINGWQYHHMTDLFWGRLSLIVQVCSNLINNDLSLAT